MTLQKSIDTELSSAETVLATAPYAAMSVGVGSDLLTAQLTELGPLACAFEFLQLASSKLADATAKQLKELSDRLSQQLSYLLEPIRLVECDDEQCVLQMRSSPPQKQDDKLSYYELTLAKGGTIKLQRFSKSPANSRRMVPAHVTREVFHRLAGDFVDAV